MTELDHVGTDLCLDCGAPAEDTPQAEQLPLLRHGGYGASMVTRARRCTLGCGWSLVVEQSERRPST